MNIESLVESARAGDKEAESVLFANLRVRFSHFVRLRVRDNQDREEIIQDVLMQIFSKYRDVTFEVGFVPWAYKVLEHKIYDFLRSQKRKQKKYDNQDPEFQIANAPNPSSLIEQRLLTCIRSIGSVNKRYARILVLHYQGYSLKEICSKLKISIDNCYTILSRARKRLLECVENGGNRE